MKKFIQSLLLITGLIGITIPAWGQSSTEGKEFWVALTLSAAPSNGLPTPFIAVSTKKPTTITITNPGDPNWSGATKTVGANEWVIFESEIPLSQWYPTNANSIANIAPQAGQTHNYGLKVETTEDVSVYAALWMQNSFDAANVLPTHVLQSEYFVQDYPPYIKPADGEALSMFTILATEDNTRVTITPTSMTHDGKAANVPYNVTLNAGQTYYVISQTLQSLSGTHVMSDGKKIAVFQGAVFTQIPGGKSARDCTYEQAMPVEYWGTHFVVTRSKEKDANRIRVTASNNGTSIMLDGIEVTTLNAGETWELEMHQTEPTQADLKHRPDAKIVSDAVYLQASCPVAVYSYDVSNGYKSTPSEMDNSRGDPSMVWISPLEQRINDITFGVCGTEKTDKHYINIVCPTEATSLTTITPTPAEAVTWTAVPSNPEWSYARIHLSTVKKAGSGNRVFTMKNPQGCIAHVYGNGNDESYAYSVGSAAVKQGINIGGIAFTDGYIYDQKFCFGNTLSFDANLGTDEISSVDWDFGDGTTIKSGPVETEHTYTSPGWYDVTAVLYGHQVCTDEADVKLGSVSCSFLVYRPDTLVGEVVLDTCISVESYKMNPAYYDDLIANGKIDTVQENCYDDVVLNMVKYRRETEEIKDTLEGKDIVYGYNGNPYTRSTDVVDESINEYGCSHYTRYYVHVIQCMDLAISGDGQSICPGDSIMTLYYSKSKGEILNEEGRFVVPGLIDEKVTIANGVNDQVSNGKIELPTQKLKTPGQYTGKLIVEDANCGTKEFNLHFTVNYPSDIFLFKFNNVLAVYQNKGYDFTAYQWYRNGEPVEGATSSILYLGEGISFNEGDIVYVVLTDKSGMVLPSCAQIIEKLPPLEDNTNNAPAQKVLINNKFRIIKGDMTFDIYGQRVQ